MHEWCLWCNLKDLLAAPFGRSCLDFVVRDRFYVPVSIIVRYATLETFYPALEMTVSISSILVLIGAYAISGMRFVDPRWPTAILAPLVLTPVWYSTLQTHKLFAQSTVSFFFTVCA